MGNNQYPPQPSLIREGATLSVIADSEADPQSQDSELLKHGGQSDVQDDTNPLPQSLPRGRDVKRSSSLFTLHSSLKKRTAFTLAEVLITLGIIGIVSALTMPSIVAGVQKEILKNQFKKTYSTFSNAVMRVQSDWGTPVNCYYWDSSPYSGKCTATCKPEDKLDNGGCSNYTCKETGESIPANYNGNMDDCRKFHEDLLHTYLKVTKFCENNALANGCLTSDYRGANKVLEEQNPDADVTDIFSDNKIKNTCPVAILNDGTIWILFQMGWGPTYVVDVNGHKGPNKWGYDLLTFRVVGDSANGIKRLQGTMVAVEKGGTTTDKILQNK